MAIGATAHKLVLDTTQFVNATTLSKKELGFLKQAMRETTTDAQAMAAGMNVLDKALREGAITQEQYRAAVDKLNKEFTQSPFGEPAKVESLAATIAGPLAVALAAATAGYYAISRAVSYASDKIGEQLEAIDETINASQNLGITAEAFQNIATAANFADIELGAVSSATEKMLVAISKGDTGKFKAAFELLGVSAKELRGLRADEQMERILKALQGIGNQADRVRVATQIFGDADMVRMTADGIRAADEQLERFGGHISGLDDTRFSRLDAEAKQLEVSVSALWRRLSLELAPAIADVAEASNNWLEGSAAQAEANATVFEKWMNIIRGTTATIKEISESDTGFAGLETSVKGVRTQVDMLFPGLSTLAEEYARTTSEVGRAARASDELTAKMREQAEARSKITEAEIAEPEGPETVGGPLSGGRIDRMYEEDRAMDSIVEKYRKRTEELRLSGIELELYRAKLEGLKGAEFEAFDEALRAREAERMFDRARIDDRAKELAIKRAMQDVDTEVIRLGSRGSARLFAQPVPVAVDPRFGGGGVTEDTRLLKKIADKDLTIEILEVTL